ncbi:MAG: hypothetical protein KBT77_05805 [Thalassolituus oleivorans]|uniref:hypothetical protein n=1 Tax=Thalassolituus oleivorans TaxID=187493 RepID=UPI001B45E14C|nr:hypothetical protein [Thalassolituus oleivorans]MBQ0726847.1 hypothetical protein [Thalassolituus oleivorans]
MVYLDELESSLVEKANELELALYRFLEGDKYDFSFSEDNAVMKLCHSSYVSLQKSASKDIAVVRESKAIAGIHYTNNDAQLLAMAIQDLSGERSNVVKYLSCHGVKYQYIFERVLDLKFDSLLGSIDDSIDVLSRKMILDHEIEESDLCKAISSITSLIELFIYKKAFSNRYIDIEDRVMDKIKTDVETSFRKEAWIVTNRIFTVVLIFLITILFYYAWSFLVRVLDYILSNWDALEPMTWILGVLSTGFFLFIGKKLKHFGLYFLHSMKKSMGRLIGFSHDILD